MAYSLLDPLASLPLAFFDVETTGASAQWGDRIIEIGIVRTLGNTVVAEYQQLIHPRQPIGAGITALTGISDGMVADQPSFAEVSEQAIALLAGTVIVGHNVRFDLSFLSAEMNRLGRDLAHVLAGRSAVLDTLRIARKRLGQGGNGLQRLSRRLDCPPEAAHRALADARTTRHVFHRLLKPVGGLAMSLVDAIALQGGLMELRPASPIESPLPLELQDAMDRKGPVMMEYVDARDLRTQRVVEPLAIRRCGGALVLVAHCHLRNDRRTFKLDRIVKLTPIAANETSGETSISQPE